MVLTREMELPHRKMISIPFCTLLCCSISIVAANIFEYQTESQPLRPCELQREKAFSEGETYVPQCSEDGQFRTVQCSRNGLSCWCVDENGIEVPGSKQNGYPVSCLSFCQLQKQRILVSRYINSSSISYIPQCLDSGAFDVVQCDTELGQCWCVDPEGMEIYGTRQRGKLRQCPGNCEIRDRRILHGFGEKSPPQCSADGEFLAVQCKFVNTTDMMFFDLLHSYNKFPGAFQTFSSLRETFPEVSGYCYCADSLGRELAGTGLELLLNELYDTVFSVLEPARTFTESSLYRILQRRFLGVQLATSGKFRCPSKCEVERYTALRYQHVYVPSCDADGGYKPVQCQQGGQCWCADPKGQEIQGTKRRGQLPACGEEQVCISERRRALSRILYGPAGYFSQPNLFSTPDIQTEKIAGFSRPCPPSFKELFLDSGLSSPIAKSPYASQIPGLETTLSEAMVGMFPSRELAQLALQFTTNPKRFQENLFGGRFLKNLIQFNFTGALGTNGKYSIGQFFPEEEVAERDNGQGLESAEAFSLEVSKGSSILSKPLVDSFGRTVILQDNQNMLKFLSSVLELPEFFTFLKQVISVPKSIAEDLGEVVKLVLGSEDCSEEPRDLFVPTCTKDGRYEEVQCYAGECWCLDTSGKEVPGSRSQGKRPRCPTDCEKQRRNLQNLKQSLPAGSDLFIPSCMEDGDFLPLQCYGTNCFCVDLNGKTIPGRRGKAEKMMQCPSACQVTAGEEFLKAVRLLLSDPSALSQPYSVYLPQCDAEGAWRQVQCSGPPEQAFEWYDRWIAENNEGKSLPIADLLSIIAGYKEASSEGFSAFVKALYEAGHQNIFPAFTTYSSFTELPPEALEGNFTCASENILLDPYIFWQLLNEQLTYYPGPYTDFSAPLSHFELRDCWCVDSKGEELQGTKAEVNQVPACPGICEGVKQEAMTFMEEAEQLILASNRSHFAFGESFLMAKGIQLTDRDLLRSARPYESELVVSEKLLSGSDYALQLAAQSVLHFYWRNHFASKGSAGEATQLGFLPYIPQCDGLGNWEPIQCYESTGHCWCVDERGRYVMDSLVSRSAELPKCQTSCQRSRTNALISSWRQSSSKLDVSTADLFIPYCLETGEYAVLQRSNTGIWCVEPVSGEVFQRGSKDLDGDPECPSFCTMLRSKAGLREAGKGYIPQCEGANGAFSPMQCSQDQESCWCVFDNGEEAPGTRVSRGRPECASAQCALPFGASSVLNGAVFCANISEAPNIQQCWLVCRQGFHSASSNTSFQCDVQQRRWVSAAPLYQACQKLQLFQTVQVQAHFQLLLPPEKTCSSDYSGLLQAFQIFILDELKARGLCHLQVNAFGNTGSVSVCDDSTVYVECLGMDRLGVNVTWRTQLENIPAASLPDLHDIENAIVGENLIGAFIQEIKDGDFLLYLDSKQFLADAVVDFLRDEEFDLSPSVQLGCQSGFRRISSPGQAVPNSQGCVVCPPGSHFQNDECIPCPLGYYQYQTGRSSCIKCPVGKTTISYGATSADRCITYCQSNEQGLQCDDDGQYRPSQQDPDTKKSFCVDSFGAALGWTETGDLLTDYQCLVLRKFERAPASRLVYGSEEAQILQSQSFGEDLQNPAFQCISGCELEDACGFAAVTPAGAEVLCELYSAAEVNFNCTTSGLVQAALGNPAATGIGRLSCLLHVRNPEGDAVMVYLKRGQEFNSSGLKTFERTSFQNVLSGVYHSIVLSAASASLTDAQLFCRQTCSRDSCCDGFILSQNALDGGTILCSLMSYPDVLMCNVNGWRPTPTSVLDQICKGVTYDEKEKMFSFTVGGQTFSGTSRVVEEAERDFTTFQQVYLWKGSDMLTRTKTSVCNTTALTTDNDLVLSDSTKDLFYRVGNSSIQSGQNYSLPYQQYWIFRQKYSAEEAVLWCLTRCAQEDEFCRMADLQNTADTYVVCTLYPEAQICDGSIDQIPENCQTVLPWQPQTLYRRIVTLKSSVKSFYTRIPFQKVMGISVRNTTDMSRKAVSDGFFDCERWCDADPCCTGFGFFNDSQLSDGKIMCLTLNSVGIQTCAEETRSAWQVSNCSSPDAEVRIHPFGWYQKPADLKNTMPNLCPPVSLPLGSESEYLDIWQPLNVSSVLMDSSISNFEVVHVSRDISNYFSTTREYCLSACSKNQSCTVVTLEVRPSAVRCLFYPDTKICAHGLQGHSCRVLLKEPATYIYRRRDLFLPISESDLTPSVYIPSHGDLMGKSQVIHVGSEWKNISQFLGIPYAAPPLAARRFSPPEPFAWEETWNATVARAACWQPGDGEAPSYSVSEDCLYLNVFVPATTVKDLSVLLFFHNGGSYSAEAGKTTIDGSYLAAISNIIVVMANYRVGVFGFLSTGSPDMSGNAGLLDQLAALKWVQQNIASFGGDPSRVSLGADRGGADVTSIHLLTETADMELFRRVVLMGGSAFSPASVITKRRAQTQAAVLAEDVGCPSSTSEEIVACLHQLPARVINDAQTKLLAISGPFQYWGPVVDGIYLRETLAEALQRPQLRKVDLLIGSAQQDGLISRAKAIKKFEESQGRANSKTAFYQALQNSLGGEESNSFIEGAATWYYSLEHSTDDYSSFSRALENATRDQFITCPIINMASHWAAASRGNVFMYHVPESSSQSSSGQELLLDVQYAFGLPFYPKYKEQFTLEEKSLSLQIMQYISNFVNSGNPNYPHSFSRRMSGVMPPWPMYLPNDNGDNYKEFTVSLPTLKGLKKADCSFWSDYITRLRALTGSASNGEPSEENSPSEAPSEGLISPESQPLGDEVAYSR